MIWVLSVELMLLGLVVRGSYRQLDVVCGS